MLALYIGVLPPAILGAISYEMAIDRHLIRLLWLVLPTALSHAACRAIRSRPGEVEEEIEGYEGEFQILGLS